MKRLLIFEIMVVEIRPAVQQYFSPSQTACDCSISYFVYSLPFPVLPVLSLRSK
jgi:hypothetical protein